MHKQLSLLVLLIGSCVPASHLVTASVRANLSVNFGQAPIGKLFHFWESTGFCPPEPYADAASFLLSPDVAFNLRFIGALPRQGLMQVRIHWMLNLVTIDQRISDRSTLRYNFTSLDKLVNWLWENNLKPGFELMGNPSGYFDDFENRTQLFEWKHLIKTTAKRYIAKYGLNYVRQWNFESWNEPDHKDFDGFNITLQGFLNYYDACSEGLLAAHPSLRLGGPAESFRPHFSTYCWELLQHCANGTNYFTGERGVRIDFISVHEKGNQTSQSILDEELAIIAQIHNRLPSLSAVRLYNDEGDPLTGWWRSEPWRADVHYAAMIAKVIIEHQEGMPSINKHPGYLLSNDNGFLNTPPTYFQQRTLLTRFTWNHQSPPLTDIVQMIRKPAYILTGLLNYLPTEQVNLTIAFEDENNSTDFLSGLAAYHIPRPSDLHDSWQATVLVINSADMTSSSDDVSELTVVIQRETRGISTNDNMTRYVCYMMDNNVTNPFDMWNKLGQPSHPDSAQLKLIRNQEGPHRMFQPKPWNISSNPHAQSLRMHLTLSQPGIILCHLCDQSAIAPGKVTKVAVHNVTCDDVLITWRIGKVKTRCILTYEIEYSASSNCKKINFKRINEKGTVFTSFQFSPRQSFKQSLCDDDAVRGHYRIRAMDYWSRTGAWSNIVTYGK